VKDKVLMFKSNLKRMESIIPILKDIEKLNEALDGRTEETCGWNCTS